MHIAAVKWVRLSTYHLRNTSLVYKNMFQITKRTAPAGHIKQSNIIMKHMFTTRFGNAR